METLFCSSPNSMAVDAGLLECVLKKENGKGEQAVVFKSKSWLRHKTDCPEFLLEFI